LLGESAEIRKHGCYKGEDCSKIDSIEADERRAQRLLHGGRKNVFGTLKIEKNTKLVHVVDLIYKSLLTYKKIIRMSSG